MAHSLTDYVKEYGSESGHSVCLDVAPDIRKSARVLCTATAGCESGVDGGVLDTDASDSIQQQANSGVANNIEKRRSEFCIVLEEGNLIGIVSCVNEQI
jgi:hypothetical protein